MLAYSRLLLMLPMLQIIPVAIAAAETTNYCFHYSYWKSNTPLLPLLLTILLHAAQITGCWYHTVVNSN